METVIFDVDGTLLSTESMYMHSLQHTLASIGMPKTYEEVYKIFGLPSLDALVALEVPEPEAVQKVWQSHYHDFWDEVQLFDGIFAMLKALHDGNKKLGIVTSNTPEEFADHADAFDINQFFQTFVFAGMTPRMKPFGDPVAKAVEDLAANPAETIYIGDSVFDMQAAHNAGVKFGLAAWGVRDRSKFGDEPEYIFAKPADLAQLVLQ